MKYSHIVSYEVAAAINKVKIMRYNLFAFMRNAVAKLWNIVSITFRCIFVKLERCNILVNFNEHVCICVIPNKVDVGAGRN